MQDNQFQDELKQLLSECDEKKLAGLFLSRLEFGTAGLRGRMGAGFNCMNDVVVIQAAQGLLEYLQKMIPAVKDKGFVIGYDGRHWSKRFVFCWKIVATVEHLLINVCYRFAELSATIFLNANVKVYLFSDLVPTPFIPFAIGLLGAAAGVMVTASHNPKQDNGYKVYWENATQVILLY